MNVSETILNKLKTNVDFRRGVAKALNVTERNVEYLVKNKSDNLTKASAVKFFKEAGFVEKEIFENS